MHLQQVKVDTKSNSAKPIPVLYVHILSNNNSNSHKLIAVRENTKNLRLAKC